MVTGSRCIGLSFPEGARRLWALTHSNQNELRHLGRRVRDDQFGLGTGSAPGAPAKSRKEPWGLLAEPESEPELKRALEKGGLRKEVVKARRRRRPGRSPSPCGGELPPPGVPGSEAGRALPRTACVGGGKH